MYMTLFSYGVLYTTAVAIGVTPEIGRKCNQLDKKLCAGWLVGHTYPRPTLFSQLLDRRLCRKLPSAAAAFMAIIGSLAQLWCVSLYCKYLYSYSLSMSIFFPANELACCAPCTELPSWPGGAHTFILRAFMGEVGYPRKAATKSN